MLNVASAVPSAAGVSASSASVAAPPEGHHPQLQHPRLFTIKSGMIHTLALFATQGFCLYAPITLVNW